MKGNTIKKVDSTGKKYPAQRFSGAYKYCYVFHPDKELKYPINAIYFPYPFDKAVMVRECKTWGELFKKIYMHFRKLYWQDRREKGENTVAWHYLEDYIVELVDIFDDGTATVLIGS